MLCQCARDRGLVDEAKSKTGDAIASKCEDRVMEIKNEIVKSNMQDPSPAEMAQKSGRVHQMA